MKSFLKFIFIIFCFIATLCPNSFGAQRIDVAACPNVNMQYYAGEIFAPEMSENEFQLVANSSANFEISAVNDRRDVFAYGSLDRACAQNKFIQQILSSKYNQTFLAQSHNISSYLKNEICTRAP